MKAEVFTKEIELKPFINKLRSNEELIASAIIVLFIITPLVEMIYCLFNPTERMIPIVFYPKLILHFIHPLTVILGACIISSWIFRKKTYRIFLVMVAWMLLSAIVTGTISDLFFARDGYRNEPLSLVISYFIIFLFCSTRVKDPVKKSRLAAISVSISIIIAAYAIIVHELCVHSIIAGDRVNVTAVFCQINHYGYYLCIHIMLGSGLFSLEKNKLYRCIGFISIVINTVALALNSSFGPWLACVCAFLFQIIVLAIVNHRFDMRSLIAAMSFLFVSAIMGFWTDNIFSSIFQFMTDVKSVADDPQVADSAGTGRWELWKFTVERIFEKPLFGYGIEGINQALEEATGSSRPHNELLQYAVFYGIPAALIYIAGFFSVFIRGFKYRKSLDNATIICLTGAFAYLISSLFGNTMFYTAPFFFIFLGLGYYDASRE